MIRRERKRINVEYQIMKFLERAIRENCQEIEPVMNS